VIAIVCDRQGWASAVVDGKQVRQATVPRLLEELARRHVPDQVRFPWRDGLPGSFVQYPSSSAALRALAAQADRVAADLVISRAMASNKHAGMREAKRNPPPLARNEF
jgi:hypothetical protein